MILEELEAEEGQGADQESLEPKKDRWFSLLAIPQIIDIWYFDPAVLFFRTWFRFFLYQRLTSNGCALLKLQQTSWLFVILCFYFSEL